MRAGTLENSWQQNKCLGHKDVLLEAAKEVGLENADPIVSNECQMMSQLQQSVQEV